MTRLPLVAAPAAPFPANPTLLGAALAGLLCLTGCAKITVETTGSAGAAGEATQGDGDGGTESSSHAGGGSANAGGDSGGEASAVGGVAAGGAAAGAGAAAASGSAAGGTGGTAAAGSSGASGSGGVGGTTSEAPHITSSQNVGVMTEEQFKALCDERGGSVEVMPHCGGFATAKGFSYDSTTSLLSEHTCHGANTCAGWNCAIPD
jgi:hypothetical protein